MTDYTTFTLEELEAKQIELAASRDTILTEQLSVQTAIDAKSIEAQAEAEVSEMTDDEKAAMQNALNG